jgi:hypothetical protein
MMLRGKSNPTNYACTSEFAETLGHLSDVGAAKMWQFWGIPESKLMIQPLLEGTTYYPSTYLRGMRPAN